MELTVDVAIVGGGLGGLACAAGLARQGYDVHVFEAAQALRTSTSTLISLGGNAFNALEALHPDIVPQLKQVGCLRRCISTYKPQRDGPAGEPQRTQGNVAGERYGLRWSEVQRILSGFVPAECVHCGYYATGYTEHEGEGRVSVHFKGKPDVRARLVVAADGVRSALRKTMIPQDPGPRYLGHMNWNALLYNPDNSVVQAHGPGEVTICMDGQDSQTFKHLMFVNDAGGGYTFWQLRVQYDNPSFTPPPADSTAAAAAAGSQQEEKPYLVGGGLGKPGSKARVISLLQEAGFTENIKVVEATPESDIFERALLDRLPLDEVYGHMSSPGKRVVLLGDAGHAMHSGPGQGGRTAFEDAHTLMAALDKWRAHLQRWQSSAASDPATQVSSTSGNGKEKLPAVPQVQLNGGVAGVVADEEAVHAAVAEYEQLRLARTCRIQRRAAEGAGLDSIFGALRPQGTTPEEYYQRDLEFHRWLAQYPDHPTGDPGSTWWKPPADMAAAGAPAGTASARP